MKQPFALHRLLDERRAVAGLLDGRRADPVQVPGGLHPAHSLGAGAEERL